MTAYAIGWLMVPLALWAQPARDQATYPHRHEKHLELKCAACHAEKPQQTTETVLCGHATCVGCHNFAKEAITKSESFCGICHRTAEPTDTQPGLFAFPKPGSGREMGSQFSHVAHAQLKPADYCATTTPAVQTGTCLGCHRPSVDVQPTAADIGSQTGHAFCFQCHCDSPRQPDKVARRDECSRCHQAGQSRYVNLSLLVPEFRHAGHVFDTRPRKTVDAAQLRRTDYLCTECHRAASQAAKLSEITEPRLTACASCHTGKPGLPERLTPQVSAKLKP